MKYVKIDNRKPIKDYKNPLVFFSKKEKGVDVKNPKQTPKRIMDKRVNRFIRNDDLFGYKLLKIAFDEKNKKKILNIQKKYFKNDKKMRYYIDRLLKYI